MRKDRIALTCQSFARAARLTVVSSATAVLLTACLGGSDSVVSTSVIDSGGGPSGSGPSISGSVVKGAVSGSTVTVYNLNSDGSLGASLGSATTSSTGAYTVALSSAPPGAVALVAVGGTYVSEVDGTTVIKASDLMGALASVPATGTTGLVITPLSDMMVARARALAAAGTALGDALTAAETLVKSTYGIKAGTSLETVVPAYDKASIGTDAFLIGLVLGSLDKCDAAVPTLRGSLFAALSSDFSDGVFDGKKAGAPITVGTGTSALSSTAGTSDFLSCVSGYVATGKAITDRCRRHHDHGANSSGGQFRDAQIHRPVCQQFGRDLVACLWRQAMGLHRCSLAGRGCH